MSKMRENDNDQNERKWIYNKLILLIHIYVKIIKKIIYKNISKNNNKWRRFAQNILRRWVKKKSENWRNLNKWMTDVE